MKSINNSNDTCRSTDLNMNISLPFDSVNSSASLHIEAAPSLYTTAVMSLLYLGKNTVYRLPQEGDQKRFRIGKA